MGESAADGKGSQNALIFLPFIDTFSDGKWQFAAFCALLGHANALFTRRFLKTFVIIFGVCHILPLHKRGKILAIEEPSSHFWLHK
ncbi:MAG: hypothetical protein Q4G00_17265 [Clostridia bacterium]|nr:hypothetical protein [Clostridia bacterium]